MRNPELAKLHEAVCRRLYRRGLHRDDLDGVVVGEIPALDATFWDNALELDGIDLHKAALPYLAVSPVMFSDRLWASVATWLHNGCPAGLNWSSPVAKALGTSARAIKQIVRAPTQPQDAQTNLALLALQASWVASAIAPRGTWNGRLYRSGVLAWGLEDGQAWFGSARAPVQPKRKPWTLDLQPGRADGCIWARAWRWYEAAFAPSSADPLLNALLALHWIAPSKPPRSEDNALWNRLTNLQMVPGRLKEAEEALRQPLPYDYLKELLVPVLVPREQFVEMFGRAFSGDAPKAKRLEWIATFNVIKDAHKFAL